MHPSLLDWEAWMRASGHSDDTIRTRLSGITTLQKQAGLDDPREVTTRHVIAWLGGCSSAWTRRTYWVTVRRWCDFLVATGQRADDPCEKVPKPRQPHGVPRPVSSTVVRKVLADPPGHRAYAYVALAAYAGLRVHEIAKIRGEDVDLSTGWLYVCGKGGQKAAVPMHPVVQTLAKGMPEVGWWFPGRHGHVTANTVSQVICNAFRSVGSNATAHQARHLFGTTILKASGDIRVTQQLMRHESLQSTQTYTQVTSADMVRAIGKLDWVAA